MAKGYPGRKRARKAYWMGIKSIRSRRGFNPYTNPRLRDLFERGRKNAAAAQPGPLGPGAARDPLGPPPPSRNPFNTGGGGGRGPSTGPRRDPFDRDRDRGGGSSRGFGPRR